MPQEILSVHTKASAPPGWDGRISGMRIPEHDHPELYRELAQTPLRSRNTRLRTLGTLGLLVVRNNGFDPLVLLHCAAGAGTAQAGEPETSSPTPQWDARIKNLRIQPQGYPELYRELERTQHRLRCDRLRMLAMLGLLVVRNKGFDTQALHRRADATPPEPAPPAPSAESRGSASLRTSLLRGLGVPPS